ncbi:MAG: hypothetical protein PSN04_07875 [Methyloprofundus sp.]|nr:hypothetical protein [Methyloprofundus sp.]
MSNLRKKNENNNKAMRNVGELTTVSVLQLNRWVLGVIAGLMAVIVFMGAFLIPQQESISFVRAQKAAELYEQPMNPVLSAEVDALKSQLVGLVSGSIESKLKILEESLRKGSIGLTGMETIHSLQDDLQVLKTYSKTGAGRLIATKPSAVNVNQVDLVEEVGRLKSLVTFLITSCSLMFAAFAGVWVRKRYVLTYSGADQQKIS